MADASVQYCYGCWNQYRRRKIIKSVGMNMVKLERYQGFSADLAGAICLLYSSLMGVPVSTTHKDKCDHGSRRSKKGFCDQFWSCKRYDADLDFYVSGLRTD